MRRLIFVLLLLATVSLGREFLGIVPNVEPADLGPGCRVVGRNAAGVLVVTDDADVATPLATELRNHEYYRVRLLEPAARAELEACARVLNFDGSEYLVEVSPGQVEGLMLLGAELARINLNGWRRTAVTPALPRLTSNPTIEQLVALVSPDSVLAAVRRLQNYRNRYSTGDSCAAAAQWIRARFLAYGCDTVIMQNHTSGHAPNVIGIRHGTAGQRNPYAIIDGHYDSYAPSNAPGADDNASGTVAAIEACRVMQGFQFERDLRFIAFSGEEFGLYGSDYYAGDARSRGDSILGVLNFDMIGYEDAAPEDLDLVLKISDPPCEPFGDWFIAVADTYTTLPCNKQMVSDNQNSDHGPFWNNGYLSFCGIEDFWPPNPHYHTSHDSIGAGYNDNLFCTEVIKAGVAALATLGNPIPLNQPLVGVQGRRIDDAAGNNDGFWDAAESIGLYVTLKNYGTVTAHNVSATIATTDPYVTLFNTGASYGDIAGSDTVTSATPFTMRAAQNTPREHMAGFTLTITATETTWQNTFQIQVGRYLVTDPVPDGPRQPALYWAYDDVDAGYLPHPTYNWVEIRSQGTRIPYAQNDEVVMVNLPVGFGPLKLYGQRYTQVSVSADGWIAAGNYTTSNYSNAALPSTSAPRAAFFANWDDLYPDYNNSGYVYWHHDAANHRFIVEYDSVSYYNPTSTKDKFQVIIYDTTLAATDGNSVVVVQYMTANRYSSSTAGLQDQTQAIGIQDLYNGTYAHGAASIAAGRAIKYTTDEPTGIAESPSTEARAHALLPTIVRRTLFIPPSLFTPHSSLFTAAGRRALPLRPGPNDVSCLAPGIYFLRLVEGGETRVAKTLVLH